MAVQASRGVPEVAIADDVVALEHTPGSVPGHLYGHALRGCPLGPSRARQCGADRAGFVAGRSPAQDTTGPFSNQPVPTMACEQVRR
jgi:hypothetical protein